MVRQETKLRRLRTYTDKLPRQNENVREFQETFTQLEEQIAFGHMPNYATLARTLTQAEELYSCLRSSKRYIRDPFNAVQLKNMYAHLNASMAYIDMFFGVMNLLEGKRALPSTLLNSKFVNLPRIFRSKQIKLSDLLNAYFGSRTYSTIQGMLKSTKLHQLVDTYEQKFRKTFPHIHPADIDEIRQQAKQKLPWVRDFIMDFGQYAGVISPRTGNVVVGDLEHIIAPMDPSRFNIRLSLGEHTQDFSYMDDDNWHLNLKPELFLFHRPDGTGETTMFHGELATTAAHEFGHALGMYNSRQLPAHLQFGRNYSAAFSSTTEEGRALYLEKIALDYIFAKNKERPAQLQEQLNFTGDQKYLLRHAQDIYLTTHLIEIAKMFVTIEEQRDGRIDRHKRLTEWTNLDIFQRDWPSTADPSFMDAHYYISYIMGQRLIARSVDNLKKKYPGFADAEHLPLLLNGLFQGGWHPTVFEEYLLNVYGPRCKELGDPWEE